MRRPDGPQAVPDSQIPTTRDYVLEDIESLLAEAVACSLGTMTRIIGPAKEADQIMVYAFDDASILVIPIAGQVYVARSCHDRGHFQRMLEEHAKR